MSGPQPSARSPVGAPVHDGHLGHGLGGWCTLGRLRSRSCKPRPTIAVGSRSRTGAYAGKDGVKVVGGRCERRGAQHRQAVKVTARLSLLAFEQPQHRLDQLVAAQTAPPMVSRPSQASMSRVSGALVV
jgi:hypothetical protein